MYARVSDKVRRSRPGRMGGAPGNPSYRRTLTKTLSCRRPRRAARMRGGSRARCRASRGAWGLRRAGLPKLGGVSAARLAET
eukprot:3457442-Pyramimonas_sp.AAC.1